MLTRKLLPFFKLLLNHYLLILLVFSFFVINLAYIKFGNWVLSVNTNNFNHLSAYSSLLGASATTFAAITAALLVLNWKNQHNLALISDLTSDIWDLHSTLSAEIFKLTYNFSLDTKATEYKSIISELIQTSAPLRTKIQKLQILLEKNLNWDDCDTLESYIEFLEYFYPWYAPDLIEFRNNPQLFSTDFKYIDHSIIKLCQKYICIE
ncbi:MAG: hypothetical protein KA474_09405 [Acinetobacter sp.]|nr:hypothetical protein [Acinetobacter sp.]